MSTQESAGDPCRVLAFGIMEGLDLQCLMDWVGPEATQPHLQEADPA